MAISVVQRKLGSDNNGGGGSASAAFASNITAGSAIIVVQAMSDSTAALWNKEARPPTDTLGNKYYLVQNSGFNSTAGVAIRIYVAYNSAAGANTVTATDNSNEMQLSCYEVSGLATYAAADKSKSASQASTTAYDTGNLASTTYANEILIAGFASVVGASPFTVGTNFSNLQNQADTVDVLATEERIVSSTGTYNATATANAANQGYAAVSSFADTALVSKVAGVSVLGTPQMNTTSGTHSVTATPAVGDLIVLICCNTGKATTTSPTDNNADGLGTYTLITSALKSSSADILEIYVRDALIGSATSTTFTQAPGTTTGGGIVVYKVTGMTKYGSTAIKQTAAKQDNQSANTTPAPTFGAGVTSPNPVIAAVLNTTNSTSVGTVQPVGFVRGGHNAYATPATSLFTCFSEGGQTGTAMTFDAQSQSAFCSVAVELDSSGAAASTVKQLAALGVG